MSKKLGIVGKVNNNGGEKFPRITVRQLYDSV